MPNHENELLLGIADLRSRLQNVKIEILETRRWRDRRATYFVIGRGERHVDIVLSDEFVTDLPNTREHQRIVDAYASALAQRIRVCSPNLFYSQSGTPLAIEITWPIQAAIFGSQLRQWLPVRVKNAENGLIANCAFSIGFSFEPENAFELVKSLINRARTAVDGGAITFYSSEKHPHVYQPLEPNSQDISQPRPQAEIERFIAGKVYSLGFKVGDVPGEVWVVDPWDAEYLGASVRELSQSAYVLRARGLIEIDQSSNFATAANKLLISGWPAALGSSSTTENAQETSLSTLPKKENLLADVRKALEQRAELALLVIDLDHFKSVNDTKGHSEGDACLERVVRVIARVLGRKGTLYRWGGDEFAASLLDFSAEEAHVTAERIRRAVEEARPGDDLAVTTSIGVSATDQIDKPSAEKLLDTADRAMYVSKRSGKNRVTSTPFADRSMDSAVARPADGHTTFEQRT